MSRICSVTGKGPNYGNNRSHSLRATRRVQNVNLQKFKINVNGVEKVVKISARGYRNLVKNAKSKPVSNVKVEAKPAETKPVENKVEEAIAK